MSQESNLVGSLHHLKAAKEHLEVFHIGVGYKPFKVVIDKIDWSLMYFKTHPAFPRIVIDGLRNEINSDCFQADAIAEKARLIPPNQRDAVEAILDRILAGEEIKVVKENEIETEENY